MLSFLHLFSILFHKTFFFEVLFYIIIIMANNFKFFYDFHSPLARSLYILFEKNKVPCEKISIALRRGKY